MQLGVIVKTSVQNKPKHGKGRTVDANLDLFFATGRSGSRWLIDSNSLDAAVCYDVQRPSWSSDDLRLSSSNYTAA